jgi:hypothetical protein
MDTGRGMRGIKLIDYKAHLDFVITTGRVNFKLLTFELLPVGSKAS